MKQDNPLAPARLYRVGLWAFFWFTLDNVV